MHKEGQTLFLESNIAGIHHVYSCTGYVLLVHI